MNKETLELDTRSNICTIINEYKILKEDTEKRIALMKQDIEDKKEDEIIKAKNKIYDYFDRIQDSLPDNFKLSVIVDSMSIMFQENCVVVDFGGSLLCKPYHLSNKNKKSKFGNFMIYDLSNPIYIIHLVKAWDKIKREVETKIQESLEKSISNEINSLSTTIKDLELLIDFNS